MEPQKKILLALPASVAADLGRLAKRKKCSRSALIRSVLQRYVEDKNRQDIAEQMKEGYLQMGELNLGLAEDAVFSDSQQQISYEETLSECEFIIDD